MLQGSKVLGLECKEKKYWYQMCKDKKHWDDMHKDHI
jgi:hypothetical protein